MTTIPGEAPAELVKPLAEMLLDDYDSEFDASHLSWKDFVGQASKILTAMLPLTYRYWFEQAFGTAEEIRARSAEAAHRKPDDIAELCELARPGWHAKQVRSRIADQMRRAAEGRRHYANGYDRDDSHRDYLLGEAQAFENAARLAEDDNGTVMCGLLPVHMWTDEEDKIARGET